MGKKHTTGQGGQRKKAEPNCSTTSGDNSDFPVIIFYILIKSTLFRVVGRTAISHNLNICGRAASPAKLMALASDSDPIVERGEFNDDTWLG